MFFERRCYTVREYTDAGELAERLDDTTWTLCTGFRIGDVLFVNDSTGPDGAQEYAALDEQGQFESITFSWIDDVQDKLQAIVRCLTDPREYLGIGVAALTDHEERFGRACSLCA